MRRPWIPVAILSLAGALAVPADLRARSPQGSESPGEPGAADRFAPDRAILASGTPAEKAQAIDRLLASGDAAALAVLRDALAEEDRDLRSRITLGLLRSFPAEAPALFLGLLDDPALPRREAALFALGLIDHPESIPRLVAALGSPEKELREAAARALTMRGREGYNGAYVRATGGPRPPAPGERRRTAEAREAIVSDIIANGIDEFRRPLLDRFADREAARRLRTAYSAAHPEDAAAARIVALGERLASWTPRSSLPEGVRLSYTIAIENLVAKSTKSVPIAVGAEDFAALHYHRYALDRAIHFELPIDELLLDPERCAPVLIEGIREPPGDPGGAGGPTPAIRYRLPERTGLLCGIGILNIAYWEGSTFDGRDVELLLHPETGLPTAERVTDAAGAVVFEVEYADWIELAAGAAAPARISVRMAGARIGAQVLPMRYELRFRAHDGVWLLDGAEAFASPESGEEMRAIATVSDVSVVREGAEPAPPAPPRDDGDGTAPAPPPAGAPGGGPGAGSAGGESTGESAGQASRGGSPRS